MNEMVEQMALDPELMDQLIEQMMQIQTVRNQIMDYIRRNPEM
jgi:hypothetical protein